MFSFREGAYFGVVSVTFSSDCITVWWFVKYIISFNIPCVLYILHNRPTPTVNLSRYFVFHEHLIPHWDVLPRAPPPCQKVCSAVAGEFSQGFVNTIHAWVLNSSVKTHCWHPRTCRATRTGSCYWRLRRLYWRTLLQRKCKCPPRRRHVPCNLWAAGSPGDQNIFAEPDGAPLHAAILPPRWRSMYVKSDCWACSQVDGSAWCHCSWSRIGEGWVDARDCWEDY